MISKQNDKTKNIKPLEKFSIVIRKSWKQKQNRHPWHSYANFEDNISEKKSVREDFYKNRRWIEIENKGGKTEVKKQEGT